MASKGGGAQPTRTYTATALTLLVRKYRGTERVVTFYSQERGRIEAVAKGVGKPGSTLAPAVEMFALSKLLLRQGRDLDHLSQAEVVDSFYELRDNMRRLAYASYVAELVARTTEVGEASPGLFELLIGTLQTLRTAADPEPLTWAFGLRLLDMLGLAPQLEACTNCGSPADTRTAYSPAEGGIICGRCRGHIEAGLEISLPALAAVRALRSFAMDAIGRVKVSPQAAREIRRLLQMHIGYHMGIELRSQEFLVKMAAH